MVMTRNLVIVADDYGIGPETSRGILDVARERRVTAAVLLVTSPYAADAVAAWRRADPPADLGWHPCLTLDRPVLPPEQVPSLVDSEGRFWRLGTFLRRACLGRLIPAEVAAELRAQFERFHDLVGGPPPVVNTHQHVGLFGPVGRILLDILSRQTPRPYFRRIREPLAALARVQGAKVKRVALSWLGAKPARRAEQSGFPGCDVLVGITDPPCVADEAFFIRWLRAAPGASVELVCHPGHLDETLIGRDCRDGPGVARRGHELHLLR